MKKYTLLCVLAMLCAVPSFAQGGRYDSWVVDSLNRLVANPTIRVCPYTGPYNAATAYVTGNTVTFAGGYYTAAANSTNSPPSTNPTLWTAGNCPTTGVLLYADKDLTFSQPNPFLGDSHGNYGFFAATGTYVVQANGYAYYVTISSGGGVTASGNNAFTGNNTHGGTETFNGPLLYSNLTPATRTDQVFVFEGDSRTAVAGGGTTTGDEYPTQVMTLPFFSGRGTAYNVATGGDTCAGITSEYATQVAPHKPDGTTIKKAYLFVMIGINDAMNGIDAATTTSCIQSYWTAAKADGFTVVAMTNFYGMNPGYTNGCNSGPCVAAEGVRLQVNDNIRASSIPDYIIDIDQLFPPAAAFENSGVNSWNVLYNNSVHLNHAGNHLIATYVNAILSAPGTTSVMRFGYPEKIWARSSEFHVLNGAITAGSCMKNSSQAVGDLTTSRGSGSSCDAGVVWFGNDNTSFIQRFTGTSLFNWSMSAGLNLNGTAPKLSVNGIPGGSFTTGDISASRSSTSGCLYLGTDGTSWLCHLVTSQLLTPTGYTFITGDVRTTDANGANENRGALSELITLSTSGATTDSVANLLPANSVIRGVSCRVTTTITTATNWSIGDATTAARFISANSTLTAGTTAIGLNHVDQTGAAGPKQTGAAKLRITTTGTPGAGAIRCTVFYDSFSAPTS